LLRQKAAQEQLHAATQKVKHSTIHTTIFKNPLWKAEYIF